MEKRRTIGKRHNKRSRAGLTRSARIEQLNRIYERDQGICQLCIEWVRRDLASRDHIKELQHGGCNCDENLRLTHVSCNQHRQHGLIKYVDFFEGCSVHKDEV